MDKIIDNSLVLIKENEKLIANILHDVKSPLYSIKIALQSHLDCELNKDVFEVVQSTIEYIENFLLSYNFKLGRYADIKNKITPCNIKNIVNKKIENYKYIFINKKICIDLLLNCDDTIINSIEIFISSIVGNLISNIAFHASSNKRAQISIYRENKNIIIEFENFYEDGNSNFNLGLGFCCELTQKIDSELKFSKTKNKLKACLKLKNLS